MQLNTPPCVYRKSQHFCVLWQWKKPTASNIRAVYILVLVATAAATSMQTCCIRIQNGQANFDRIAAESETWYVLYVRTHTHTLLYLQCVPFGVRCTHNSNRLCNWKTRNKVKLLYSLFKLRCILFWILNFWYIRYIADWNVNSEEHSEFLRRTTCSQRHSHSLCALCRCKIIHIDIAFIWGTTYTISCTSEFKRTNSKVRWYYRNTWLCYRHII